MPRRRRREPSGLAESVTFWSVVIFIAAIVAFLSFRVGRDWLGKRLGTLDMSPGAPRIVAQADMDPENAARIEQEARAPEKAEARIEERDPSYAETLRIQREDDLAEPQDGASLNTRADDEGDPGADSKPPPDEPKPASKPQGRSGGFTVTAGAFSSAENASRTLSQLTAMGYKPYIEKIERNGKTLHRVNVAVVKSRGEAEQLKEEVAAAGINAGLVAGN